LLPEPPPLLLLLEHLLPLPLAERTRARVATERENRESKLDVLPTDGDDQSKTTTTTTKSATIPPPPPQIALF